jgi:RNA polymerase sigma-70 factor (ECF subfamily)
LAAEEDAFVARDPAALERTYRAYSTLLYSIARQILGNDDDAMDCVHDALVRVWHRPNAFRAERGSLRVYLSVCVRNEAIGRKRDAARHLSIERRVASEDATCVEVDPADHLELELLRKALVTLPVEQRDALELAYFRHLTQTQIAETLHLPLGTVKSRLKLALRKLRAEFTPERR